jgi:hypothetical protein
VSGGGHVLKREFFLVLLWKMFGQELWYILYVCGATLRVIVQFFDIPSAVDSVANCASDVWAV